MICVHDSMAGKEDPAIALAAEIAEGKGFCCLSFDLPGHGPRLHELEYPFTPWNASNDLTSVYNYAKNSFQDISIFACGIGAYLTMLIYPDISPKQLLFLSPAINVESSICSMMERCGVIEEQLEKEGFFAYPDGRILDWEYYCDIIEEHPINANYQIKTEEVTALLGDSTKCAFQGILLLFKGIISGQLDTDRADYLLRDSIHTGVNYGLYDKNRLINCIDVGQMEETGDLVLAVQNGGWHIAESLVLARYQMFSQVYFHKTRRAYDHHVSFAVKEILNQAYAAFGGFYPTPEQLDAYVQLDDWSMYGKIKEGLGGKHGDLILQRRHYRKAYETSLIPTPQEEEKFGQLREKLERSGVDFFEDEASTKWYKLDKDIYICDKVTGYVKELSRVSPIVRHMVDTPRMKRLYYEKK